MQVAKTLTCESCGYSRSRVEAFTDFSLDLVEPHQHDSKSAAPQPVLTIPDLLRGFFKRQVGVCARIGQAGPTGQWAAG